MPNNTSQYLESYFERAIDPGAPYFYKYRPIVRPFMLRNPYIGKALAGNFLYPAAVVGNVLKWFQKKDSTKYSELLRTASAGFPGDSRVLSDFYSEETLSRKSERPGVQTLTKALDIYLWNDWKTYKRGGTPYISLDFPPSELSFTVKSQVKAIGVLGANYPPHHYTGSQETVTFEVMWYDFGGDSEAVVTKCRKIEALSKADGYRFAPTQIYLDWGGVVPGSSLVGDVMDNHVFIVQSADYKLSNFLVGRGTSRTKHVRHGGGRLGWNEQVKEGIITPNGFKPLHAIQTIVLKREASQLTHKQIIGNVV